MNDINAAYRWAIATCNDPNVRYSMTYRDQQTIDGLTYYDCSSFIWYALIAGGFDCVAAHGGNTWPFTTNDMGGVLLSLGFRLVSRTGTLLPGDIGVHHRGSAGGHTEMVYVSGNASGVFMGAHGSSLPAAQQVSINTYTTPASNWDEIYRYQGGLNYEWHNKNTGGYSRDSIECQENVLKIMSILMPLGWTSNAIAGVCGNIEAESGFNPWRWQSDTVNLSGGYGLFQYTPATNYINDANAQAQTGFAPNYPLGNGGQDDGTAQLNFMMLNNVGGGAQYIPTTQYPLSFSDFQTSTESPEYLASAWLKNFERAGVEVEEQRRANAAYWYEWINNHGYIPGHVGNHVVLFKRHWIRRRYRKR